MLTASALTKSFGGFQALSGCSLEVAAQSITGIIGPNGAGKSTLFNVLGGLLAPQSGDVVFEGRSILGLRADERARIGLVRTFQISRALMLEPKLILLDEPTSGVSPAMTESLGRTIQKLRREGLTFAIIEHDMDVIARLCAPIYVLAEGRTLIRGSFREVASNEEVMRAYLGKAA